MPASIPQLGDIVSVRTRHHVVEATEPDPNGTVVSLACLDDDAQGERLDVVWELELDGKIVSDESWEALGRKGFDSQGMFAAFFNTLRWHCVTATNPRILQSPFRAGIRLDPYQLEPLRKALLLPRVNLFIADDVGLGKTIEAGLIASELLLRRRIDTIIVSCPPAMQGQWKDEMESRFGLGFEILDRHYVERIRRERGFGVNAWTTFPRFIVSHRLLIDENYASPLRDHLGTIKRGSLLILDEAHHAAPASGAKYAVDSKITRAIRELSHLFEHRLFLSATPHNGHSNSFSALLELLDPQRFTRGVPVFKGDLDRVMVRRLKSDIRGISGGFPERKVVQEEIKGLPEDSPELVLAALLDRYIEATEAQLKDATKQQMATFQLVASHLQQRLFSSIEAFARTLAVHRRALERGRPSRQGSHGLPLLQHGVDRDSELAVRPEEEIEEALDAELESASSVMGGHWEQRRSLLDQMQTLADAHRHRPDARVRRLLEWMRAHQCAGAGIPQESAAQPGASWTGTRVILFTEYEATLTYLQQQLRAAFQGTDQADKRVAVFRGSTGPENREAIKQAFNTAPGREPVRILLATDAAREGLNLQAYCHHLFHFDLPWNPGRLEQRNGRIDRKLQPADEVYCHYFVYAQRPEDRILQTLVRKTETIREQLGSVSSVLDARVADFMTTRGMRRRSVLDMAKELWDLTLGKGQSERKAAAEEELEATRELDKLRERIEFLGRQLEESRKALHFDPATFESALCRSLELSGLPPLQPAGEDRLSFPVDAIGRSADSSWSVTLDSLRQPPRDGKRTSDWRRNAPVRPVSFRPPETVDEETVQLHLGHRVAQRLLSKFLAQGFLHHELSRACFSTATDATPRVILLGRLGLYGPGASRLHEEILTVTARWIPPESRTGALQPFARDGEKTTMTLLEEAMGRFGESPPVDPHTQAQLIGSIARDIAELRPVLDIRAEEARADAQKQLDNRAEVEAKEMVRILQTHRDRVRKQLEASGDDAQLEFDFKGLELRQIRENRDYWHRWLETVDASLKSEPQRIRDFYAVATTRVEPVGLVYLWPNR